MKDGHFLHYTTCCPAYKCYANTSAGILFTFNNTFTENSH